MYTCHERGGEWLTFLPSKEYTKPCDAIFKKCLFDNVVGITQQRGHFLLNHFMKRL